MLNPALLFTGRAVSLNTEIKGVSAALKSEGCCEVMTMKVGDKVMTMKVGDKVLYTRVRGPSPLLLGGKC